MKEFYDVLAFHKKFGLPCGTIPQPMSYEAYSFRLGFLYEEESELHEAHIANNLVHAADALLDLAYVAIGTALFIGTSQVASIAVWPRARDTYYDLQDNGIILPSKPRLLPKGVYNYHRAGLRSLINMFCTAHKAAESDELNAIRLAIASLKQIVHGCQATALLMGVPWEKCWQHVQDANMAKRRALEDGSDSKRSTSWDVVKPDGWVAPDANIARELLEEGWEVRDTDIDINFATGRVKLMKTEAA